MVIRRTLRLWAPLAVLMLGVLGGCATTDPRPGDGRRHVLVGDIEVRTPEVPEGMQLRGDSATGIRRLVRTAALARLRGLEGGAYRFDVIVERVGSGREIRYEARVIVSDASTDSLRHLVRSVASASLRPGAPERNARVEDRVVIAATERAVDDAIALVRSRR